MAEKTKRVVGPADAILYAVVIALIALGVVAVYSASSTMAAERFGDGERFVIRQAIFAALGVVVMRAAAGFDYRLFRSPIVAYTGLAFCAVLVAATPHVGAAINGARRWIRVGPISLQPAEMTKVALVLWLSYSLAKKRDRMGDFKVGFLPHALVTGFLMLLCLRQPDFGSAVMMGALTFILLFVGGTRIDTLAPAALIGSLVAFLLVRFEEYRWHRVTAFLDPRGTRAEEGFQLWQSLLAFASGGVDGVGLGESRQKFFIPEAHNDMIISIVAEELGFIGVSFVVLAFATIVWRGMRAATRARDDHGTYLAVGITAFLGLQAFLNLGVAMGLLPTKGLVLPFMSYGGSSLLVNCGAVGILLNVSRERREVAVKRRNKKKKDEGEAGATAAPSKWPAIARKATRGAGHPSTGELA